MADARTHVTKDDVVAGLRRLGVEDGTLLFVHAAMGQLGHMEGGPEALLDALQEAVGPKGTLALPGFSFQLKDEPEPVFDVRNTPTWASKVYEAFRKRPGVHRSHHVTHSVCAIGVRAAELTATHSVNPCGEESPFRKLAPWGATIIFLGVSHNSNTTLHAVEEQERLPHIGYRLLTGATIIDETGSQYPIASAAHDSSHQYDFNRLNAQLDATGVQHQTVIGDAILRAVDARGMYDLATEVVRRDPTALLKQGETWMEIPVSTRQG